jgi:hypothetical protein
VHSVKKYCCVGLGLKVHERAETNEVEVLTKGDNNLRDGRGLYAHGQMWLQRHHIMGWSVGHISQLLPPTFQYFSVFVSSHI